MSSFGFHAYISSLHWNIWRPCNLNIVIVRNSRIQVIIDRDGSARTPTSGGFGKGWASGWWFYMYKRGVCLWSLSALVGNKRLCRVLVRERKVIFTPRSRWHGGHWRLNCRRFFLVCNE
jgi:hypothetical protein